MTEFLGIILQHATTKHEQKFGMLERTHASLREASKYETGEKKSMWDK